MKKEKEPVVVMPMKEFGMSEYFKRLAQWKPFFILEWNQLVQNMACPMTGENFLKQYKKFIWKK